MAGTTEPAPKHRDIVIVTSSIDSKQREVLKAAHMDDGANYHFLSVYELSTKARGLTLSGLVLDRMKWDQLTDDGRLTVTNASLSTVRARGLKSIQDLITYVK